MLLLAVLAAMMLVASPVLAWQAGPNEGNKYWKYYYPTSYFKYCEPNGAKCYGDKKASKTKWCNHYYTRNTIRGGPTERNGTTSMSTTSGRLRTATGLRKTTGITASITSTMTRTPPLFQGLGHL